MLDITKKPARPLVAPSILAADFANMAADCKSILDAGADLLHIDIMDGHFVPNLTLGQDMIRALRNNFPDTYLDVHLMVTDPDAYIESFAAAGANSFTFHIEVTSDLNPAGCDARTLIQKIRDHNMNPGLVINPPTTDPSPLEPYLDLVDIILVMSVNPGRGGQSFIPETLEKTKYLAKRLPQTARLEIDGGINPQTAKLAANAGVDILVAGSAVFAAENPTSVIEQLHHAAD